MVRSLVVGLLAGTIGLVGAAQAASQLACWPVLAFKDVRFSEMQPPRMERKWTAILAVDASRCATTSGRFGIVFSRAKENGMTIDFQEQFTWRYGFKLSHVGSPSVVVYNLNILRSCISPAEANAPLIVNADVVLSPWEN